MKSYIVITIHNRPVAILTTKKALERWMDINGYKYDAWIYEGKQEFSKYKLVKKDAEDSDAMQVSYFNRIFTENASEQSMTRL